METEIVKVQSKKKLGVWTVGQVWIASFLAGPIGGCYLISKNYKALDNEKQSKKILIVGIICTFILSTTLMLMPDSFFIRMPKMIIPIVCTGFTSTYAERYQKIPIRALREEGYKKGSFIKLILISITLLLIQISLIFLWAFFITFIEEIIGFGG